jgi:hypothetical protein
MFYIEYVTNDDQARDPLPGLARATGFAMPDAGENRKGRISTPQMVRVFGRALRPVRYTGPAMIGWLVFVYVIRTWVPGIVFRVAIGQSQSAGAGERGDEQDGTILRSAHCIGLLIMDPAVSREETGPGLARFRGEKHMKCSFVITEEYFEVDEDACAAPPEGRRGLYHTRRAN